MGGEQWPEELRAARLSDCINKVSGRGNKRVADDLARRRPCPMVDGLAAPLVMTRAGFIRACLGIQRRRSGKRVGSQAGRTGITSCVGCPVGRRVKGGRGFVPFKGLVFKTLEELENGER